MTAELFKHEFCLALSSVADVCERYARFAGGSLPLDTKKTAVLCSYNLLVSMIAKLPPQERAVIITKIGQILHQSVLDDVSSSKPPEGS